MTFLEVLNRRGISYKIHGPNSDKVSFNCLFCVQRGKRVDTNKLLCVHLKQGWSKCVHCDWSRRYGIKAILHELDVSYEVDESVVITEKRIEPVTLPKDFQLLTKTYDELDRNARRYLIKRGVTPQQIRDNRIGVSFNGKFRYRIIFPIYEGKQLRAINARDFTDTQKPKYLNSKGDKYLFHFDPEAETVILSEGVIKCLRIAQVTDFCSTALLGHDLTDTQFSQIKRSKCKHVIIYPDPDTAGFKGAVKIADLLSSQWLNGFDTRSVSLVQSVSKPADEESLMRLKNFLKHSVVDFTGLSQI
jgi:DNA primase catalytic core, N-terminal domain